MMTTFASRAFRTELELALGWHAEARTLAQLAVDLGATVARVRYHVAALEREGRLVLSRDACGRVLVALPAPVRRHGLVRRLLDGAVVCEATPAHLERSARAAARELRPRSGAPEPGLGVIVVGGFRCWVEPELEAA